MDQEWMAAWRRERHRQQRIEDILSLGIGLPLLAVLGWAIYAVVMANL